jgi:hypothetical protein
LQKENFDSSEKDEREELKECSQKQKNVRDNHPRSDGSLKPPMRTRFKE